MSTPKYVDPEDLTLYAMQLLTPEETARIEAHLEQNASARAEVADIQGSLAALAFSAESHSPAASARTRLMTAISREKRAFPLRPASTEVNLDASGAGVASIGAYQRGGEQKVIPFEQEARRRGVGARVLPWAGWAVAAGFAVTAASLYREREALRGAVATEQTQVAQTTADANAAKEVLNAFNDQTAKRVTLTRQGALLTPTGRTTYSAEKGVLIFTASNMEPLDTFKVYELWLIPANGGDPVPAGTFRPDAHGYASMISTTMPKGVDAKAFGITMEDSGGSKTPTLPILMTGV